ncbi:hypothetical protein NFA_26210 [Nocardia farcinica IFM 10152]|uniref:Uncharacterized protein n=1 Tax=Nocardia farcinica (strain IFM 10152) TaxID=247156 RepID=Q5YWH3_NOCFA|nr:hypothetical protein NFA_26210 [Nocardia farcinica IFM 10152]
MTASDPGRWVQCQGGVHEVVVGAVAGDLDADLRDARAADDDVVDGAGPAGTLAGAGRGRVLGWDRDGEVGQMLRDRVTAGVEVAEQHDRPVGVFAGEGGEPVELAVGAAASAQMGGDGDEFVGLYGEHALARVVGEGLGDQWTGGFVEDEHQVFGGFGQFGGRASRRGHAGVAEIRHGPVREGDAQAVEQVAADFL